MTERLFFSVGEPSGDQHAARLIRAIQHIDPRARVRGFGGSAMAAAGCEIDYDLTQLAVMGVVEVVPRLRDFFRLAADAEAIFRAGEVDRVVLVDFPGFNWHIAKRAKRAGLPVDYYLPPQLWAWAPWRIKKVRKYVDRVLCALPFEYDWYHSRGIDCHYVGHPFFDAVAETELDQSMMARCEEMRQGGRQLIALLPGSRDHEVHRCGPLLVESARRLSRQFPDATFLVAAYRDAHCLWLRDMLTREAPDVPVRLFVDRTSEVIELADAALMVSGSVSLELMARKTPAVVLYRVGRVFYALAKRLVTVDSFTLPNLIAGETVFPEFASTGDPEPAVAAMTSVAGDLVGNEVKRQRQVATLERLVEQYGQPGASLKAARLICGGGDAQRAAA